MMSGEGMTPPNMEAMQSSYQQEQQQNDQEQDEQRPEVLEEADPKVIEFLKILDEYRIKNEDDGNYLEAKRAKDQHDSLRKQEFKRQIKALKARHMQERQDVQIAHNMQYAEFNAAWDKYMEEFDQMAQMYIQQMTEKHAVNLREFQEKLHQEIAAKPPKFSKELLDWRKRQGILAKQKHYAEAQKIKRFADAMEDREKSKLDGQVSSNFAMKEERCRAQQRAELQALLKRIDCRRKEHIVQRKADSKRLLQRNRNVQAVLESKQAMEERIDRQRIKGSLSMGTAAPVAAQRERPWDQKKTKKKQPPSSTFVTQ